MGSIEGGTWTRWRIAGEGQVRFWLRPLRPGAGLLLCAVPVRTARDLREAEEMLLPGRHAELVACPVALASTTAPRSEEQAAGVVFVALTCNIGGFPLLMAAASPPEPLAGPHQTRAVGKLAAAGDTQDQEDAA